MQDCTRTALALLLVAFGASSAKTPPAAAHGGDGHHNLQVLPRAISDAELNQRMTEMGSALGVQCEHCHEADRASDGKAAKGRARDMLRMVDRINKTHLAETPVSCWTCHRGAVRPPEDPK